MATAHRDIAVVAADLDLGAFLHAAAVGADAEVPALEVSGQGTVDDWWRVVAVAAWDHLDRTGQHVGTEGLEPPR